MPGGYQQAKAHHALDDSWMSRGACRQPQAPIEHVMVHRFPGGSTDLVQTTIFFAERSPAGASRSRKQRDVDATERAKAMCRECPVCPQCLDFALEGHIEDGVWAATTPDEREAMRSRRRAMKL